jgi:hypothetical protein
VTRQLIGAENLDLKTLAAIAVSVVPYSRRASFVIPSGVEGPTRNNDDRDCPSTPLGVTRQLIGAEDLDLKNLTTEAVSVVP